MKIYIALPALNEANYISNTLECLVNQQTDYAFEVVVCVNQPDDWWDKPEQISKCENNIKTLKLLEFYQNKLSMSVLDRSSRGKGWQGKEVGVGYARKTIMDYISGKAQDEDIIISMDADTTIDPHYIHSIVDNFSINTDAMAISVPYYHPLSGNLLEDISILRYEIYMRNYAINMLQIDSPFAYTALGSAIAYRQWAYRKIGGMSPVKSGEDFYFLQQIRKVGKLIIWNDSWVKPAARFSDRVFFGTGPAMIKGAEGNWESYPIYNPQLFNHISELYCNIENLYIEDRPLLFLDYLKEQFKDDNFLAPLRKNFKNIQQFKKAIHTKIDGLRILQFLKTKQKEMNYDDFESLKTTLSTFFQNDEVKPDDYNYRKLDNFEDLVYFRQLLFEKEMSMLKEKQTLTF
jgi:glycosyltransferase involved in cell wall biosynthesis